MASIKIDSDLRPIGSELFLDSESYLEELSANDQISKVVGGTKLTTTRTTFTFPTTSLLATTRAINPATVAGIRW